MATKDKNEVLLASVRKMKKKGVTAIKLELEANINRDGGSEHEEDCGDCEGRGYVEWETGDERWYSRMDDDPDNEEYFRRECGHCAGEGTTTMAANDGEQDALIAMLNNLGITEDLARIGTDEEYAELTNAAPWLPYIRLYNDHSVDTEVTLTISLADENNIFKMTECIAAFKAMCSRFGSRFDTNGAGLHMALLFSEDYTYPTDMPGQLTSQVRKNFRASMSELMPALYMLASKGEETRGFLYRAPRVAWEGASCGGNPKYSAIYINGGAIEYRVFDTCYDNPEQVFDNVVVIANTLKYLSPTYVAPKLVEREMSLNFGVNSRQKMDDLYSTVTHLDLLNAGLRQLKPSYLSVGEVKALRHFKKTKTTFNSAKRKVAKEAPKLYKEYRERQEVHRQYRIYTNLSDLYSGLNTMPPAEDIEYATTRATERTDRETLSLESFVEDQIHTYERRGTNADYVLNITPVLAS